MNRAFRLMQAMWLGVAIMAFGFFVYAVWTKDTSDAKFLFAIVMISCCMFFMKKWQRKKLASHISEHDKPKEK
ncbi:MAG: hypothetical protein ABI199_05585 [Bacteroidia bacterium]